jgi:hypothetical protein
MFKRVPRAHAYAIRGHMTRTHALTSMKFHFLVCVRVCVCVFVCRAGAPVAALCLFPIVSIFASPLSLAFGRRFFSFTFLCLSGDKAGLHVFLSLASSSCLYCAFFGPTTDSCSRSLSLSLSLARARSLSLSLYLSHTHIAVLGGAGDLVCLCEYLEKTDQLGRQLCLKCS